MARQTCDNMQEASFKHERQAAHCVRLVECDDTAIRAICGSTGGDGDGTEVAVHYEEAGV